jgi:hypothetical protein
MRANKRYRFKPGHYCLLLTCHSGMVRQHQTRNLEIPDSMLRIAPG